MSVRDDEPMPVLCDGCEKFTYEPRVCEEGCGRFCAFCADHDTEHDRYAPRRLTPAEQQYAEHIREFGDPWIGPVA